MKVKKFLPFFLCFSAMASVVCISSAVGGRNNEPSASTAAAAKVTESSTADGKADEADGSDEEMRGVWVSYMELSMENESSETESAFTEKFTEIARKADESGFNTLIVQVRPFCDALYKSSLFPWSHILTGTQGEDPGYDPLEIMCDICGEYGLKIHAWVNPYRISTSETPSALSVDNPYSEDNSLGIETDSGVYLDPSSTEVQELICGGVKELCEGYDIDGVQFDDYFYPTEDESFDSEQYAAYTQTCGENAMSLSDWRKANVSLLISNVYRTVKNVSPDIEFGISPQGNLSNNDKLSADAASWCANRGFIDYICPQLYYSLTNPALAFEDALDDWCDLEYADGVKLYVGLAGYKAGSGDYDSGTWLESNDILASEYEILKADEQVSGFMLYSFASLENSDAATEIESLTEKLK